MPRPHPRCLRFMRPPNDQSNTSPLGPLSDQERALLPAYRALDEAELALLPHARVSW